MGSVDWSEPSGDSEAGVDHLGMRVAGELAYAQLLDFTTTVSWRPRYFSFWCSALRRAFADAGGRVDDAEAAIDLTRWRASLRRQDYAIAAATLLADPDAVRVAGSDQIRADLGPAPFDDARLVALTGEHLGARNGSLSIYLGPMLQVGLLQTDGVVHRPGGAGALLADAFDASLAASGVTSVLSAGEATIGDLRRLGELCGLARLARGAGVEVIDREREALRAIIVPPLAGADLGRRRRVSSIVLLLDAIRRSRQPVGLDEFREYVLLDGNGPLFEPAAVFPSSFEPVQAAWRSYQAHAYATLALEALLAAALSLAFDVGPSEDELREQLASLFSEGAAVADPLQLGGGWSTRSVTEVVDALEPRFDGDQVLLPCEPTLARALSTQVRGGRVAEPAPFLATCTGLLLLTLSRMRRLEAHAPDAWQGSRLPWRLPPKVLVAALERAIASGDTVAQFAANTMDELVLRQHRRNALRKLEAAPSLYTARFVLEEGRVVVVGRHQPGTSNPRVENALVFLTDLGFLTDDRPTRLTEAGARLLDSVRKPVP